MKLAFVDAFVCDDEIVDLGVLVSEVGTLEVLGYMGVTRCSDEMPPMAEATFPQAYLTSTMIAGETVAQMEQGALDFLDRFLEEDEGFALVIRGPNVPWKLEALTLAAACVLPAESLDDTLDLLGIPTLYRHDAVVYADMNEARAVNRAAFLHGEVLVYGNNIRGWGADMAARGAVAPEPDPNQPTLFE